MNDNAKGFAKSAGAQLRRYGEQALREVRVPKNVTNLISNLCVGHSRSYGRMEGRHRTV